MEVVTGRWFQSLRHFLVRPVRCTVTQIKLDRYPLLAPIDLRMHVSKRRSSRIETNEHTNTDYGFGLVVHLSAEEVAFSNDKDSEYLQRQLAQREAYNLI